MRAPSPYHVPDSQGPARRSIPTFFSGALIFVYYLAIIALLLWIYGRGDTPTAPFVYQGF